MSKQNRKLTITPVKESAAAAVVRFRANSTAATVDQKADQFRGVKMSASRSERFRLQAVKHN